MKFHYLLLLLLINCSITAQEYIKVDQVELNCYYRYEFQEDSTYKYSARNQEMILQIGKEGSKYTSTYLILRDSLNKRYIDEPIEVAFKKMWSQLQGSNQHRYARHYVYRNYPENNTIFFNSNLKQKKFWVPVQPMEWKIIPNSDTTFLDYQCQKATTHFAGRDYIALFTLDIPISDGPYKFKGLPGLIVKVEDTKGEHKLSLEKIEKPTYKQPIYFVKRPFTTVTPQEYTKALQHHMQGLLGRVQNSNKVKFSSEDGRANSVHRLRSINNFIEQY